MSNPGWKLNAIYPEKGTKEERGNSYRLLEAKLSGR
jgi:hypothetical protein